jgi:AcrR family transcriptional regulator
MSMTAPRRSYAKTHEVRDRIASAALDLVLERGHAAVTTTEIAARAGMQKTAALYHFPSKDHMLIAALEEHGRRTHASESANLLSDAAEQARRGVNRHAVVRLHQAMIAESHNPEHPAHDYFREHYRGGIEHFAEQIRTYQARGLVAPSVDPIASARLLLAAWGGLQTQWLIEPSFEMDAAMTGLMLSTLGVDPASAPLPHP